jgi:hypothetical protein
MAVLGLGAFILGLVTKSGSDASNSNKPKEKEKHLHWFH